LNVFLKNGGQGFEPSNAYNLAFPLRVLIKARKIHLSARPWQRARRL